METDNEKNPNDVITINGKTRDYKFVVLFLAVMMLASLILTYSLYRKTQQLESLNKQLAANATKPKALEEITTEAERELLMERTIEGGRIAAYRLSDSWSNDLNAGVYAIRLESGEYWPVIFSSASTAYTTGYDPSLNTLFEIVGNEIWLANDQTNQIDLYTFQTERLEDNVKYLSTFLYKRSLDLPKYAVGHIYGLTCGSEICVVNTAHHQESGCTMDLTLSTELYSNIKCSGHGGEFEPQPL